MNSLVPISRNVPTLLESGQGPRFAPVQGDPSGFDIRMITGVLAQRALLAIGVAVVVFVLVLGFVMQMTPKYTAHGSMLIDPRRANATRTDQATLGGGGPEMSYIDTQAEVVKSPALARAVALKMKLYNDPEFNPKMKGGLFSPAAQPTQGAPDERSLTIAANHLRAATGVKHAGFTYVLDIEVASESPEKAARLVNALMETYIERQLDEKVDSIARANDEINDQLERMRREVETTEAAVQQYRNAHGLYGVEGQTMAQQEVSTLNQQIAQAKADSAEKRAKYQAALSQYQQGSNGADVMAALGSNTISGLRSREAELSVKLAKLQQDFLPGYPEVKRTQAELDDVRQQIQLELNRILSSLRADAQAAAQREASLLSSRGQAQGGIVSNNRAQVGLVSLQQRADSAKQIYEAYITRAKQVTAERSLQQSDAAISSPASPPILPSSPNKTLGILAALVLGVSAGAGSVLMAELWTKVLRSRFDVENELGLPFAGLIPDLASVAPKTLRQNPPDFLVSHPFSNFAEAFRNVRAFLMLGERNGPAKVVALTSAVPKEGKSTSAMCLARTLAMTGSSVVLVDCDLRLRGASKYAGPVDKGLVEVIEAGLPLSEALVLDKASGAWILPVAPRQAPLNDLFNRPQTEHVLSQLRERFDYVLLDAPPVLGVADARFLAAMADRVLFIARWNKTPVRAARAAVEVLREGGANVVGGLLSQVDVKKQALYGFGDTSDYFQYYQEYYVPVEKPHAIAGGRSTRKLTRA